MKQSVMMMMRRSRWKRGHEPTWQCAAQAALHVHQRLDYAQIVCS